MRLFNKIRDHVFVKSVFVSHLHLVSDMQTCYHRDAEHYLFSTVQNMFKNERGDYLCRCQDVWSRSTSTRSFSLSLYREAKVCRIELTYNPVWLAHDHAIDCGSLSSRNAFILFYSRHLFFNWVPRWETTANKLALNL